MASEALSILKEGRNCKAISEASHLRVLVDYATYYQALHQSICKAKRSIFVLGWDIDSRIELLRGEDARAVDEPATFYELICKKAHANPNLKIYLNKWNYALFFMKQREPNWHKRWEDCGLPNVHHCLDGMLPLGACHHQKVVVIDDEIAFWGGMDVAQGRWDKRQHHPVNEYRADPGGLPNPDKLNPFGPYHDIQAVLAGPAVAEFADLVRQRWEMACDIEPIAPSLYTGADLPPSWPDKYPPQFKNAPVAMARTVPAMKGQRAISEIKNLYLDEIAQAENFIYIENQYVACEMIARALNKQLREKPNLRVLIVSCDIPHGIFESKAMWTGRVIFSDIIRQGGFDDRIAIVYPISRENGKQEPVHIHSKIMIVDDKLLHIGSSNICNRSMGLDTEWDVTLAGTTPALKKQVEAVRNDLIREHSGREIADIQDIIANHKPVTTFLDDVVTSRQHFRRVDDEPYRNQAFSRLARLVGDPAKPLIPASFTTRFHRGRERRALIRTGIFAGIVLAILGALALAWFHTSLPEYMTVERVAAFFERFRESPWAFWIVLGFYTLGGLIFFPITLMTGACVVVFGLWKGVVLSFLGAFISSVLGFWIGRSIGAKRLEYVFGRHVGKILEKIRNSGVAGIAIIRMVPIAPHPLINMVFGISGVSLFAFVIGTFLGLVPGKLAVAVAGDSLIRIIEDPDPASIAYLGFGVLVWIGITLASHKIAQRWQDKRQLQMA